VSGFNYFSWFCLPISLHHCCCASFLLVQWRCSLLLDVDTQLKFYLLVTERCDVRGSFFRLKSSVLNTLSERKWYSWYYWCIQRYIVERMRCRSWWWWYYGRVLTCAEVVNHLCSSHIDVLLNWFSPVISMQHIRCPRSWLFAFKVL